LRIQKHHQNTQKTAKAIPAPDICRKNLRKRRELVAYNNSPDIIATLPKGRDKDEVSATPFFKKANNSKLLYVMCVHNALEG
jgi:hypothetical protein